MKHNDIDDLIERLQGFDSDELQHEMTDGLDEWCRRRQQRARSAKQVVLIALLLLTTTAIALTTIPWLRSALQSSDSPMASASPASPVPHSQAPLAVAPHDSVAEGHTVKPAAPQLVDYYYTGIAEDGYSVAYGHETRTLTYTRYSGRHIISSVVHNAPDALFADTATLRDSTPVTLSSEADSLSQVAVRSMIKFDFQMVEFNGDVLYFTVIDSVHRHVSVRGDVAQWMGQTIRYSEKLVIPATVEHEGVSYIVTAIADSAFAYHDELKYVALPVNITSIGDAAFAHCTGLNSFMVQSVVPPEASPTAFDHANAHLLLTVPCGSLALYEDILEWLYFLEMRENCR